MADVKCDFCDATAHGTMDNLVDNGWQRAKIDVTIGKRRTKKTITACSDHRGDFHKEIIKGFNSGMFKKEEGANK